MLKFPKTTGTSKTVTTPTRHIIHPNMIAAESIHVFSFRASSSSFLPSDFPMRTPVAVVIPSKEMKNRLAMEKLAAIPDTTAAFPLPL